MDKIFLLSLLLSISAFSNGDENINDDDKSEGSFPHAAVSSSLASLLLIILLLCLIYYCCNRNQTTQGFTQFNNENERNPPRGRFRWRNRRFFRRNRRHNQFQNDIEGSQSPHITIQPVVNIEIPPGEGRNVSSIQTAPPAYDESMNNPPFPSQFMNPPMPNEFARPPMMNPYMNPSMQNQFMNPSMINNFNNPPVQSNFNNPPTTGNFNNECMPSNIGTSKNPNASSYYTKH